MTRLSDTVASEATKLLTVRATYVTAAIGVVLTVGLSALLAIVVGVTWDDWDAGDRADFQPVTTGLVGMIFAGILYTAVGVTFMTREYSSGMIRLTLAATPRRGRVLAAKALALTGLMWALGAVCWLVAFVVGQAVLAGYGVPTASLLDADTLRTLVVGTLLGPVFPLVGLALGVVLRSTAGAITAVLALIFAPGIVGELLPERWRGDALDYAPGAVGDSLSMSHIDPDVAAINPALGVLVLAGWLALFLGLAWLALTRRDA